MKKNIIISGITGLVIGAGCMYFCQSGTAGHTSVTNASFNTSLGFTDPAGIGTDGSGAGPYQVTFSNFQNIMTISDSCKRTTEYTKGMLFDATRMIAMLDAFSALQANLTNTSRDTLLVGVYPAYNCTNHRVNIYFAPVIMKKTDYIALGKGDRVEEKNIVDFRTQPATSTITNNVYNFGNEWPY